jgi:hypothetical protein
MVRAILEDSGGKMPRFFGYMVYGRLIHLAILAAMKWLKLLFPS